MKKTKYITRHEYKLLDRTLADGTVVKGKVAKGWNVRIRYQGKTYPKFFSDSKYAGEKEISLYYAKKWRRRKMKELGVPTTPGRLMPPSARAQPIKIELVGGDTRYEIVCSLGVKDGKIKQVRRRFEHHGQAILFREKCERERDSAVSTSKNTE